jgi:hypothetical protein
MERGQIHATAVLARGKCTQYCWMPENYSDDYLKIYEICWLMALCWTISIVWGVVDVGLHDVLVSGDWLPAEDGSKANSQKVCIGLLDLPYLYRYTPCRC